MTSVLILVVVDVALGLVAASNGKRYRCVLILVVVDVALGPAVKELCVDCEVVLILVVVDVALGPVENAIGKQPGAGLNPCCSGCGSLPKRK